MTTTAVSSSTATTSTSTTDASKQLSSNFDTFLTLLTTQLKNQDPTAPMDSTQFTQQLVMFSQVEQQINTNTNLTSLISAVNGQSNNEALGYIGKNVVMGDGTGVLTSGSVKWTYGLDNNTASTTLTVTDSSGKTVYSTSGSTTAGTHDLTWDGKDYKGNQLPDGAYKLTVHATASDGTSVDSSVASKGIVSAIDYSGSSPQLVIGTSEVPLSSATLVSN